MAAPFYEGAKARLHTLNIQPGGWAVILARPPAEPSLRVTLQAGAVTACITHDCGLTWPDRTGQQIVRDVLDRGGVALLGFETLGDAAACMLRLRREGVQ